MCIQVANGSHKHTGSLTPGEITVQDAEGNVISSRASFSLEALPEATPPTSECCGFVTPQIPTHLLKRH